MIKATKCSFLNIQINDRRPKYMAKDEMKKVGFNLHLETIEKLEECLRLKNRQLSVTGATINKQELVEEMINDYYYRIQGSTNDADTVNKINTLVDDSVDAKFDSKIIKMIEQIAFNTFRIGKLSETILRTSCGTFEEQINKRMNVNHLSKEQAEEEFNNFIANDLFQPCPFVEAIDAELFDDEKGKE